MKRIFSLTMAILFVTVGLSSCERSTPRWELVTTCDDFDKIVYSEATQSLWVAKWFGPWIAELDTRLLLALEKNCALPQLAPGYFSVYPLPDGYEIFDICDSSQSIYATAYRSESGGQMSLLEYDLTSRKWEVKHELGAYVWCQENLEGWFAFDGSVIKEYKNYNKVGEIKPLKGKIESLEYRSGSIYIVAGDQEIYYSTDPYYDWYPLFETDLGVSASSILYVDDELAIFLGHPQGEPVGTVTEKNGSASLSYPALTLYQYRIKEKEIMSLLQVSEESGNLRNVILSKNSLVIVGENSIFEWANDRLVAISFPWGVTLLKTHAFDSVNDVLYVSTNQGIFSMHVGDPPSK